MKGALYRVFTGNGSLHVLWKALKERSEKITLVMSSGGDHSLRLRLQILNKNPALKTGGEDSERGVCLPSRIRRIIKGATELHYGNCNQTWQQKSGYLDLSPFAASIFNCSVFNMSPASQERWIMCISDPRGVQVQDKKQQQLAGRTGSLQISVDGQPLT